MLMRNKPSRLDCRAFVWRIRHIQCFEHNTLVLLKLTSVPYANYDQQIHDSHIRQRGQIHALAIADNRATGSKGKFTLMIRYMITSDKKLTR